MFNKEVFPAPDAPKIAVTFPGWQIPETLSRMTLLFVSPSGDFT